MNFRTLLVLITGLFFTINISSAQTMKEESVAPTPRLKGEIDAIDSACTSAGITLSSLEPPTIIEKVRLGSPALYANLAQGDKVLALDIKDNKLSLLIERNGQKFYAQLKTSFKTETPVVVPMVNQSPKNAALHKGNVDELATRAALRNLLINHDLSIIVDRSGSMIISDCPDYPKYISRWEWCLKQSTDLAQIAASAASSVTLIFFDNTFNIWRNVSPQNIPGLFIRYTPVGTTLLAPPLLAQLNDSLSSSVNKPSIVLILSDGMPQDSPSVAALLQNAAQLRKYRGQLVIVFLLIGTDTNDEFLLAKFGELNAPSVKNGGIFAVVPFTHIIANGFRKALLDELNYVQNTYSSK